MVTIDFETYYDKEFSLSKVTTEAYIRSPKFQVIGVSVKVDEGPIEWITGNHKAIADGLAKYKLDEEVVIAHNAAFDMAILNWVYGIRPKFIIDTLSMARPVIGISVGGSLRALAEHYGIGHKGTEVYNTLGKRLEHFTVDELQRFGEYCRNDVLLTWELWKKLKEGFPVQELYLIDLSIRMFTEPTFVLDKAVLASRLAEVQTEKANLLASVGATSREDFMSNDKFAEMLRRQGVEPPTKISPTTGKEAYAFAKTDEGMKALLDHPNEMVQLMATARLGLKSTIEETRTQSFLEIAERGPMPIMLNYYGAINTGRFSGGERLNPQNLPRGGALRASMCAPKGYKIVASDSSNVEARTLAWFAGQQDLVGTFASGRDAYSEFASIVYGRPINKHDNPNERHVGKTCLAGDTEVLTNSGWKKIVDVSINDLLWDGEEWVQHSGVINQGTKNTLSMCGVTATPDHLCWTGTKYEPWKTLVRDGKVFQSALDSASLPSSDSQGLSQKADDHTDGNHTVDVPADGKAV